jgi:hypothetical protein
VLQSTERLPESRRLELNAYLTKPITRLARYPLLLEAVLKHTPDDSPDKHALLQVVKMVREFLTKVNTESGKAENRASLQKLNDALFFKPGEDVVCVIRLCSFWKQPQCLLVGFTSTGGRPRDGSQGRPQQTRWRTSGFLA